MTLNEDDFHRQRILGVVLKASVALCGLANAAFFHGFIVTNRRGPSEVILPLALLFMLAIMEISKKGYPRLASRLLISTYYCACLLVMWKWGADLPAAILLSCLLVILSGVLVDRHHALRIAILLALTLCAIGYLQGVEKVALDRNWRQEHVGVKDTAVYSGTLFVIVTLTWLFEQQVEGSMRRARQSEKELRDERDQLEIKIEERTKELRQAEYERLVSVQRFTEFGRQTAELFHDLVNPLTTQSLNLELLSAHSQAATVVELREIQESAQLALNAAQRMERFVRSARRQVSQRGCNTNRCLG